MECSCSNTNAERFVEYENKNGHIFGKRCKTCSKEWELKCFKWVKRNSNHCKVSRQRIMKHNMSMLKPGDHIAWHRLRCFYWHHAIVVDIDTVSGTTTVIEYGSHRNSDAVVQKNEIKALSKTGIVFKINYELSDNTDWALARARSLMGESKYNLLTNNCECFVTFCKTGINDSAQVKAVCTNGLTIVRDAVLFILVMIALLFPLESDEEYAHSFHVECAFVVIRFCRRFWNSIASFRNGSLMLEDFVDCIVEDIVIHFTTAVLIYFLGELGGESGVYLFMYLDQWCTFAIVYLGQTIGRYFGKCAAIILGHFVGLFISYLIQDGVVKLLLYLVHSSNVAFSFVAIRFCG
ncbi:hypothetical protein DPMN_155015 [Dreissena polymorpha]|uniref:LRAT domain-containing protein n=1 Tax=Dreissena polymorpha TaxID=45954 RepID=A0A9D4J6A1_DREPO|nr:hypothetical protein DPMN_155015 [Dreissena polymorpha]